MSKMKKFVGILLAAVMVCAMSVAVLAADTTYTITITYSESGHTYEAYQIFTGDLDSTGKILSNIVWGSGVKSADLLTALKGDTTTVTVTDPDDNTKTKEVTVASLFSSCSTAADVAKVLSDNNDSDELAERFAQLASENLTTTVAGTSTATTSPYTISSLTAGYYLVKDKDNSVTAEGDSYTDIILEVVADVTVKAKADTTELDKIISDTDSDNSGEKHKDDTTADYSMGDDVPFTLTATLPSNYDDYKTYKLTFHDTLTSGLTFNNDVTVAVYTAYTRLSAFDSSTTYYKVDSTTGELTEVDTTVESTPTSTETYYIKTVVKDGYTVATSTSGVLSDSTCTFEVQITNTNSLYDVNNAIITVTNSSKIVVTYTAKLNDNAKTVLAQTNTAKVEYSNNPNDNGSGTGNTPDDVTTVFTFDLTANKVDEDGTALSGAGFTLYKAEEVTITGFAADTTYYILSVGLMTEVDAAATFNSQEKYYVYNAVGSELTGVTEFKFSGLGTGYYKLVETTTPDGYNTMDDLYFSIEAVTEEDASGNASVRSLTIKDEDGTTISSGMDPAFTVSTSAQTIDTDITNKKGSTLPTTGGIGTTVFYVVGGVLVLGAAVLLITKKRMSGAR